MNYFGPSWGPDDVIMFDYAPIDSVGELDDTRIGLYSIRADGTEFSLFLLRSVTSLDLFKPVWSPDGRWIALNSRSGVIYKLSPRDSTLVQVVFDQENPFFDPTWSPDGRLLAFARYLGGTREIDGLYAAESAGGPARHLKAVDGTAPSWSPQGREIAFSAGYGGKSLAILDTLTSEVRTIYSDRDIRHPQFSPDGSNVLFYTTGIDYEGDPMIMVVNRDGTNPRILVHDGGVEPAWSPDGKQIVYVKLTRFSRNKVGNGKLWIMRSDGSNRRQLTW